MTDRSQPSPPPAAWEPGGYRILDAIGGGEMAEVFLAVKPGSDRLMALKILRADLAHYPAFLGTFVEETWVSKRLEHANVIRVHEVGLDGERPFMAMDHLAGQPVSRIVHRLAKDGGLSRAAYLEVVTTMLAGLHHAHERPDDDGTPLALVHCDVSPANVFVTYDGHVKLVGFGFAKTRRSSTASTLEGKVAYKAPEQARGECVDRRADVFSAGVMLWEAATGKRLWKADRDISILRRLLSGEIRTPRSVVPDVPKKLEAIIQKALAHERDDRHTTAAELRRDLQSFLDKSGPRVSSAALGELVSAAFAPERARLEEVQRRCSRVSRTERRALVVLMDNASRSALKDILAPTPLEPRDPLADGALVLQQLLEAIPTPMLPPRREQSNAEDEVEDDEGVEETQRYPRMVAPQAPDPPPPAEPAPMAMDDDPIDFAILTAQEVERRAACAVLGLGDEHRVRRDGRVCWRGRLPLPSPSGDVYTVLVAQATDVANIDTALLTDALLRDFEPGAALLVGIAAGSGAKEIRLGDVVVGKRVLAYERGAETFRADSALLNSVQSVPDWDGDVGVPRPDGDAAPSRVHRGVIASGEKDMGGETARRHLGSAGSGVLAVEMDGFGFNAAVWQNFQRVRHLVIRGIADDGSPVGGSDWHAYAARAAARFTRHFLLDRPLDPRKRDPDPPAEPRDRTARNNLPPRRDVFVGRAAELEDLRAALGRTRGGEPVTLSGLGGVGKTVLALALAHAVLAAGEYPGGIWWVNADAKPIDALERLAGDLRTVGPPGVQRCIAEYPPGAPAQDRARAAIVAIQNHPEPTLLVLDDVGTDGWAAHMPGGMVSVLRTTRAERFAGRAGMKLGMLPAADARALAVRIAGEPLDEEDAAALDRVVVRELSGLAVAVEMAAMRVAGWQESWRYYEKKLATTILDERAVDSPYPRSVTAALDLSIQCCAPYPPAPRLLEAAAAFAPDALPLPWAVAAAGLDLDDVPTREALTTLTKLGLLTVHRETRPAAERLVSMHRLVHRRVCAQAPPADFAAARMRAAACVAAWLSSPAADGAAAVEAYRPHVDEALAAAAGLPGREIWFDLAQDLGRHLQRRARFGEARQVFQEVLEAAEALEPPAPARVSTALSNLALVLARDDRPDEARPLLERSLEIAEQIYPPTDARLVTRLVNLGMVLGDLEQPAEACRFLERALAIDESAGRAADPSAAKTRTHLAGFLTDLGRPEEARDLLVQAFGDLEGAEESQEILATLSNLALSLNAMGQSRKAYTLLERARDLSIGIHGPTHPDVATILVNLAEVRRSLPVFPSQMPAAPAQAPAVPAPPAPEPAKQAPPPPAETPSAAASGNAPPQRAKTLLVVDDSKTMRQVLEITFRGTGLRVVTANSPDAALQKLESDKPVLVISDLSLDPVNGYDLCKAIKKAAPRTPVVLLSSKQNIFDAAKGTAAQADYHMDKPFLTQQMLDTVEKLLGGEPLPAPPPLPAGSPAAPWVVGNAHPARAKTLIYNPPAAYGGPCRVPAGPVPVAGLPAVGRAPVGRAPVGRAPYDTLPRTLHPGSRYRWQRGTARPDPASIKLLRDALAIEVKVVEVHGAARRRLVPRLTKLAVVLHQQGEGQDEPQKLLERALEIGEAASGPRDRSLFKTLLALAQVLPVEDERGIGLVERALAIAKSAHDALHPLVATAVSRLIERLNARHWDDERLAELDGEYCAKGYAALGDVLRRQPASLEDAIPLLVRAHYLTASNPQLDVYEEAIDAVIRAVERGETTAALPPLAPRPVAEAPPAPPVAEAPPAPPVAEAPPERADWSASAAREAIHLAVVLVRDGRAIEALPHVERAMWAGWSLPEPDDRADLLAAIREIAVVQWADRRGDAMHLIADARASLIRARGAKDPALAVLTATAADFFWSAGKEGRAIVLFERALAIQEACTGPDDPSLVDYLETTATALRRVGRPAHASRLLRRALTIAGDAHPRRAVLQAALALTLLAEGVDVVQAVHEAPPTVES